MSGTPLTEFTTFMASQGPAWASGAEAIINENVKRNYTHARIANGKRMDEMVQAGDSITDTIFLDPKSTTERYNPHAKFNPPDTQTGTQWTVPWAFLKADMSWSKHTLGLNKDTTTSKYRSQKYKSVMFQKHQNLWTDINNHIDDEFWATPNYDTMEATSVDVRVPQSIPVLITENTAGVPLGVSGSTAYSTVQGINPTNEAKWRNQSETYTYSSAAALSTTPLFTAMTGMYLKTRFARLPKGPQYSDKTTSPHVIMTSLTGFKNYEFALRVNQDEFRGIGKTSGQDPAYDGPTFRNIPLEYIEALDAAALYDNGSSVPVAEASADLSGPRYYFVNGEYLNFIWHSENYCVLDEPTRLAAAGQPFTYVQYVDCWNNLIARSRMRHGIVTPSADTTDA